MAVCSFMSQWGCTHIAGMNQISEKQMNEAEKQFKNFESMINSMTLEERSNPDLLAKVIARPHFVCTAVLCMPCMRGTGQSAMIYNAFRRGDRASGM